MSKSIKFPLQLISERITTVNKKTPLKNSGVIFTEKAFCNGSACRMCSAGTDA